MSRYDFSAQRLFLDTALAAGLSVPLDRGQANYLVNVLRMNEGAPVLVFNGREGEWLARLGGGSKRAVLHIESMTREQTSAGTLDYCFAPLKQARLDYMVQKAVEMGAARLRPVITRRSQVTRLNGERLRANAIEAAEQCGILALPEIAAPTSFADFLGGWDKAESGRHLIFCDEDEVGADPIAVLKALPAGPLAVLIGPEGGFSPEEREMLRSRPFVTPITLGPRILRADTAAVAALALVQAVAGDWREV